MYKRNIFYFALIVVYASLSPVYAGGNEAGESTPTNNLKEQVLNDSESVMKGDKKFHSTCAYCHGAKGSGGIAKKLQGRKLKADYIFNTITNGKKRGSLNMPPWRGLPEEVRWQLTAYILSLQKK